MKKILRTALIVILAMTTLLTATVTTNAAGKKLHVTINQSSVSLVTGKTQKLGYSYYCFGAPKWSSSNSKVATVSSTGVVTAKAAGTATITYQSGKLKDTCKVTVTKPFVGYRDTKDAYTYLNNYRKNAKLATLKRDATLEKVAKIRAKEIVTKFSHTRPNGKSGLTLITGNKWKGENIAKGQKTCKDVTVAWYNSKGHRENMLRKNFTKVGIACYEINGVRYWVQMFSN